MNVEGDREEMQRRTENNPLTLALEQIFGSADDTFVVVGTKRYALSDPALSGKALRAAVRLVVAELREVK